jgi:intracellular sulfur oxidation DsrE/DsrF family protein
MKIRRLLGLGSCLIALFVFASPQPAVAQEEKPFAEHKFVLQISDMDPAKQTLVLNVANNIIKAHGVDQVDIEIVAFSAGLRLLFEDNSNSGRIDGLAQNGVRFFACSNTIANMSKTLGRQVQINEHASTGKGGIIRIEELVNQGYILVKP